MKQIVRYKRTARQRLAFILLDADTEPCEILMAFFMFIISAAFWIYGEEVMRNPAFHLLGVVAPYQVWGATTLVLAVNKLLSAMYDSLRWRLLSTTGGCFVWCMIGGSIWAVPVIGIGSLVYPAFAAVSLWLGWRIGWRGKREGSGE